MWWKCVTWHSAAVYIYLSLWEGPNSQRCLQGFLNVSDDAAAHDHEALEIIEIK